MTEAVRLDKIWNTFAGLFRWPLKIIFSFSSERNKLPGPSLVVSNHVTNYDPLFLAASFPKNQMHFVASEHLFRLGWLSAVINFLAAPIARRKGSKGFDAAMTILRKVRAGRSVCLFAEGETSWNGCSQPVYSATATVARASGGFLVTYRLEGGYLTAPRWGKGIRRGRMQGRIVNIYSPEQLKAMTDREIELAINNDIYEDAFERQKSEPVLYRCKHGAQRLEVALCMCPECRKIGTLTGKGNYVRCSCGFETKYNEYGFFEPEKPFPTIREWEKWQHEQLLQFNYVHSEDELFADDNLKMKRILTGHAAQEVMNGKLTATPTALVFANQRYEYADISDLALVTGRKLLFTHKDEYFELSASKPICFRKYQTVWANASCKKS